LPGETATPGGIVYFAPGFTYEIGAETTTFGNVWVNGELGSIVVAKGTTYDTAQKIIDAGLAGALYTFAANTKGVATLTPAALITAGGVNGGIIYVSDYILYDASSTSTADPTPSVTLTEDTIYLAMADDDTIKVAKAPAIGDTLVYVKSDATGKTAEVVIDTPNA
jgi:hypothetical protein